MSLPVSVWVLLGVLLVATVTDLRSQTISNRLVYPGMLLGILLRGWEQGWSGIETGVSGFVLLGMIMLLSYTLFSVGGGDVKLVAMMGGFLGVYQGLEAMLWTFVLGAALAISELIWRVGLRTLLVRAMRYALLSLRSGSRLPLTDDEKALGSLPLHLAPAALLAVVMLIPELVVRVSE